VARASLLALQFGAAKQWDTRPPTGRLEFAPGKLDCGELLQTQSGSKLSKLALQTPTILLAARQ